MPDFGKIDTALYAALDQLRERLREHDYNNAKECLDAGEPGLALRTICQQLYEYETHVPARVFELLKSAAN